MGHPSTQQGQGGILGKQVVERAGAGVICIANEYANDAKGTRNLEEVATRCQVEEATLHAVKQ